LVSGQVQHIDAGGQVTVQVVNQTLTAAVATHIPGVIVGQQVLLATADATPTSATPALIVAAWPMTGAPITPPWQFDRNTESLSLKAVNLSLSANHVLLQSEDAQIQLSNDGRVTTRGQSITAAALETHRIEGGVIELN
jgi:hypothetical protein